jgi:hypothetical protein
MSEKFEPWIWIRIPLATFLRLIGLSKAAEVVFHADGRHAEADNHAADGDLLKKIDRRRLQGKDGDGTKND